MELENVIKQVILPGLAVLPAEMNTPEAIAMLLTIGLQESRFEHRKQIGGPARGFYQFEKGGGLKGVLRHPGVKEHTTRILEYFEINREDAFDALTYNDTIATAFARLLLWTDPKPIPPVRSHYSESWDTYARVWRPGKPHPETWPVLRAKAVMAVTNYL